MKGAHLGQEGIWPVQCGGAARPQVHPHLSRGGGRIMAVRHAEEGFKSQKWEGGIKGRDEASEGMRT